MESKTLDRVQLSPEPSFSLPITEKSPECIARNSREADILLMLVEAYIRNGVPISSFYLVQKRGLKLSSATVRSILANLEEKAYLYSPHRSSGRLPTEKAYRFYIENLLPPSRKYIEEKEERYIQEEYLRYSLDLVEILKTTGRLLSMLTNYAVLVSGPDLKLSVLKHLELVDMGAEEVLVIFVTRVGKVLSAKLFIEERIPEANLRLIARRLNRKYKGMGFAEIHACLKLEGEQQAQSDEGAYDSALVRALARDFDLLVSEQTLLKEGIAHLHSYVEEQVLQRLYELIQNRCLEQSIWSRVYDKEGLGIRLGSEYDEKLKGISIVSGNYKMGEKNIGLVSVIGPTSMNYSRVVTLVEYIRHLMSRMLTRLSN